MQPNLKEIDVVILCGGLGTRLRSRIGERQKTMAEINGQPFLDILLQYLAGQGFRRAVLCTGYQARGIEEHFRSGRFGMEIVFSPEKEPLGTGGAVKNARPLIESDPFLTLNGDCFCELNYADLIAYHFRQAAQMTLAVVKAPDQKDYGSITTDKSGRILSFQEKIAGKGEGFISAGVYCFAQEVFSWMPEQKNFMLEKEFFPFQTAKRVFGFEARGEFLDIGTPERFARAEEVIKPWIKKAK